MASGTADLQRDLVARSCNRSSVRCSPRATRAGRSVAIASAPNAAQISNSTQATLMKSFSSAEALGERYPHYASAITAGARSSFLDGADWAYLAGMVAVLVGGAIVFFLSPRRKTSGAC